VFERFRQADSGTSRRHGGLGLGLSIARHLVELHGGTVTARNRDDGSSGAVLTISLPAHEPAREPEEPPSAADAAEPRIRLESLHVLVVDDEPDGRAALCSLLARWGARTTAAASAADALAALERRPADLVLADLGMPDVDGFALLRRIRDLPGGRGGAVPVAAVTAYASAEDRRRVDAAGFVAHLAKPVQPGELARLLVRLG
jgi:CheY-like chemotaxis protein